MALSTLRASLSGLFKSRNTRLAETPQRYLKLTEKCLKQVDNMISFRISTSPKFNREQCQYLVDKLKMAIRSAQSFLELPVINTWYSTCASDEDMARSLEIFKLLFALGKEVESFVQGCCKDTWIQCAMLLSNVSEHISSLCYNLSLCTGFFSTEEEFSTLPSLTVAQVASFRVTEAKIVKAKAYLDKMQLIKDVSSRIQSSKSGSQEWQLASFLLERLESPSQHLGPASQVSKQPSRSEFLFKNLKQLERLGKGAFGTVHKAMWLGVEVAKKTLHEPSLSDFLQEVSILDGLHHPNIVSLLWHMTDLRKCYMIMELMEGDLHSLMETRMEEGGISGIPFTISETLDIMLQVGEGMLFLHERKIVHRDLKSQNILVNCVMAREMNVMYLHVKVADFGLSKTKENSKTYSVQTQNQGSSRWMAPEMIKSETAGEMSQSEVGLKYPFKCDIYSFSMVCCEILTGDFPFPSVSPKEVKKKVLAGERPQLPNEIPARLRTLIEACWSSEPNMRPGFAHICAELRHLKCEELLKCWNQVHFKSEGEAGGRLVHFEGPLQFTARDLLEAAAKVLGKSTCGTVYKAMLENGSYIAVKRLREGIVKSQKDFTKELDVLGKIRHPNLLALRAHYWGPEDEKLLIYDYMPCGSLAAFLHARGPETALDWATRIRIAEAVGRGLIHLHQNEIRPIVHGNLTASNILLDTRGPEFTACISDFGLSRLMTPAANANIMATAASLGYRAPELTKLEKRTTMSDVYSFGIVLLELLTGLPPADVGSTKGALDLPDYVAGCIKENWTAEVFDVELMKGFNALFKEELMTALQLAMRCVSGAPSKRPEMDAIIRALEELLSEEQFHPLVRRRQEIPQAGTYHG